MSEAQWQAVQRLMAGILPEWTGTDLKQRSARQQSVVQQLWKLAGSSAEFLQEWKVKSAAGNEWLRQREESKGWLQLVLRAWREEVERHGGRDGRALPQHRRQVHWANDALRGALRNKATIFCSKLASSKNDPDAGRLPALRHARGGRRGPSPHPRGGHLHASHEEIPGRRAQGEEAPGGGGGSGQDGGEAGGGRASRARAGGAPRRGATGTSGQDRGPGGAHARGEH